MELPRIIGICGRRRSGKDTVANFLSETYGYANVKIADDLKRVIKVLFGFTEDQLETDTKDAVDHVWNIAPRQAMQFFGTEVMQYQIQTLLPNIGRKFWIKTFIKKHIETDKKIVISDLRFYHEYEELKKYNIYIIKLERENDSSNLDNHISEKEYDMIPENVIIKNNDSLEQLHANLKSIFS